MLHHVTLLYTLLPFYPVTVLPFYRFYRCLYKRNPLSPRRFQDQLNILWFLSSRSEHFPLLARCERSRLFVGAGGLLTGFGLLSVLGDFSKQNESSVVLDGAVATKVPR